MILACTWSKKHFKAFRAFSRAEDNDTEKGYVQHRLAENKDEIWKIAKKGNFSLYVCGLKSMEESINSVFKELAEKDGMDWEEMRSEFKKNGQWNIEVY